MPETKFQADGTGIAVSRTVSSETGREVINKAIAADTESDHTVEVSVENQNTSFSQQIAESAFSDVLSLVLTTPNIKHDVDTDSPPRLPSDFFSRLTDRQEALLTVLAEDGGIVADSEIRDRIRDEHNLPVKNTGQASGGIIGGISREFSTELKDAMFIIEKTDDDIYSRGLANTYKDAITNRLASDSE